MSCESSVLHACHVPRWRPLALLTGFTPVMLVLKGGAKVPVTELPVAPGVRCGLHSRGATERPLLRLRRAVSPVGRACQAWLALFFREIERQNC